ncbi:MAG: hypothetical protein LQ346_001690 [Caloplaca aetnensis]|nr:MAG: hypothetical protein LQ346_001690 [Caloplaca aetnensis]
MVFKPFTHLARQSLGKTLTHGYAQSVVAATQSSYASTATPFGPFSTHAASKFNKHGSSQLHGTFQHASTQSGGASSSGQQGFALESSRGDGGLAAYYEAWQKQQRSNGSTKEWKQFQFPLRIGWKGPSTMPEGKGADKESSTQLRSNALLDRSSLERAYSTSAVDDIKQAEDVIAEAGSLAVVDEAIAKEISSFRVQSTHLPTVPAPEVSVTDTYPNSQQSLGVVGTFSSNPQQSSTPTGSSQHSLLIQEDTPLTPTSPTPTDIIIELRNAGYYEEIPAVFQAMLAKDIQPSMGAYNGLLAAAIAMPAAKHQVVSKALNIYTDAIRRHVVPDKAFYGTLLELLSRRAIEVYQTKNAMDIKRSQYCNLNPGSSFMLPSDESEYAILIADDALKHALSIFDAAISNPRVQVLPSEIYGLLITACALHGQNEDMIRLYTHLEEHQVVPVASMFPPIIDAYAQDGDLNSSVQCYEGYRNLAMQHDADGTSLIGRYDYSVYAALVKSFMRCNRSERGHRFIASIYSSLDSDVAEHRARLEVARDIIVADGLVQHQIDIRQFGEALDLVKTQRLTPSTRHKVLACVCSAAANSNDRATAVEAYKSIELSTEAMPSIASSMLAMELRFGKLDEASKYWSVLYESPNGGASLMEPAAIYTLALIKNGQVNEALIHARHAFARVRSSVNTGVARDQLKEKIDEVIELIGKHLALRENRISPQDTMTLLGAMTENKGPVSPVSEQLLAGLGPAEISILNWHDLVLVLNIEAAMISDGTFLHDIGHIARLEHLLNVVSQRGLTLDEMTLQLIERTLGQLENHRPGISARWRNARQTARQAPSATISHSSVPSMAVVASTPFADAYDPYAAKMDHNGSNIVLNILENGRAGRRSNLNQALAQFQTIHRLGRQTRYSVYAKLIETAATERRGDVMFDILRTARQSVPLLPQHPPVLAGWSSILDSMTGACLTVGNRAGASDFHQELLQLGTAPSANTYGLYITTLKEFTQTSDEANEALDIWNRAKQEGVEPTSFLYNALIGKLGKARRVDDCKYYFYEMQNRGIRPTSVTYGTMINGLTRVNDQYSAEMLFNEMESMPNYKPRAAPYNSMMQYFQGDNKKDSQKVLEYYSRMRSNRIEPTMHTYKLLIDTYAALEPIDMAAAEGVLDTIRASGQCPEAVHYASLIKAKGCQHRDLGGAWQTFKTAMANPEIQPHASLYQAMFESMVANCQVEAIDGLLRDMDMQGVRTTPYIANAVIRGWATADNIAKARDLYESMGKASREPSTYEEMTRAFLAVNDPNHAREVADEMFSRAYPAPVVAKLQKLLDSAGV